jgi:hypothetical protein
VGDINQDGVVDLVVGSSKGGVDVGGVGETGALFVLLLNSDGTVGGEVKIAGSSETLVREVDSELGSSKMFGSALAVLRELDGDGWGEVVVGFGGDGDGGTARGAVYVMNGGFSQLLTFSWWL